MVFYESCDSVAPRDRFITVFTVVVLALAAEVSERRDWRSSTRIFPASK